MTFSTALCIKPFSSSHSRHRRRSQQDDPSSPKVGCMGQIRRCKAAEKAAVLPLPPPLQPGSRRFCLLMASVAFLVSPMNQGRWAKKAKPALRGRRVVSVEEIEPPFPVAVKEIQPSLPVAVKKIETSLPVALEEMDPPLPVVAVGKKESGMEKPTISLWKRRCRSRKLEELFFFRQEKLPTPIAVIAV